MSYLSVIFSIFIVLFGCVGPASLEAASKSKSKKEKSAKSKFKPIPRTIPKGVYTSRKMECEWDDGALFIRATHKINGHLVYIDTIVDVGTFEDVFEIGDQFILIDGVITSKLTIWEYGTYGGNPCMAHYYTDCTIYTTNYESVFIVN